MLPHGLFFFPLFLFSSFPLFILTLLALAFGFHLIVDTQGPLVGERISSQSIVQEYAQADPTYVAKTEVAFTVHSESFDIIFTAG